MIRFFPAAIILLVTTSSLQAAGIDSLAAKNSPLGKGEVIAFFGDSITQAGARSGGYCRLIGEAIAKQRPERRDTAGAAAP